MAQTVEVFSCCPRSLLADWMLYCLFVAIGYSSSMLLGVQLNEIWHQRKNLCAVASSSVDWHWWDPPCKSSKAPCTCYCPPPSWIWSWSSCIARPSPIASYIFRLQCILLVWESLVPWQLHINEERISGGSEQKRYRVVTRPYSAEWCQHKEMEAELWSAMRD